MNKLKIDISDKTFVCEQSDNGTIVKSWPDEKYIGTMYDIYLPYDDDEFYDDLDVFTNELTNFLIEIEFEK